MSDPAEAFTTAYLAKIERLAGEQGLTHSTLARAAFPDAKDPVGRWRKIRRQGQNLTLADAWRLARVVKAEYMVFVSQPA